MFPMWAPNPQVATYPPVLISILAKQKWVREIERQRDREIERQRDREKATPRIGPAYGWAD